MNPPYGTACNRDKTSKRDIAVTAINKIMKNDGMGSASQQLYAQFIYRASCC